MLNFCFHFSEYRPSLVNKQGSSVTQSLVCVCVCLFVVFAIYILRNTYITSSPAVFQYWSVYRHQGSFYAELSKGEDYSTCAASIVHTRGFQHLSKEFCSMGTQSCSILVTVHSNTAQIRSLIQEVCASLLR